MSRKEPNTAKLTIAVEHPRDAERWDRLCAILTEIGVALHQLRTAIVDDEESNKCSQPSSSPPRSATRPAPRARPTDA